jgi:glycosyltransferase involved in cell wall biosynthesis
VAFLIIITITLFFIILRFTVTLFNFISNPKLTRVNRPYTDFVSILIPARNEEENILTLLQSIQQQPYTHYEVLVYDDESSDKTLQICLDFVAAHPRFRVIKGDKLPAGWTGKNHACHQLSKQATGDYFLFLDAGDSIRDGLINSAVHRMHLYKLGLLSLFANQTMQTAGEKTVVPLMHYLLLNLLPLRLVFLYRNASVAVASGQFMLFDAGIYRQNEWHKLVQNKVVEDSEIMRLVKAASYNGETLLANGMISCRMFKNYRDAINGFSKNLLAAFNYSIPALLLYILLLIGGPLVVMMSLNFHLMFFMFGLIILTRVMISLSAGQNAWINVLMHPVQLFNMVIIAFLSIQKHLTKSNVWKGRILRD